MDPLHFRIGGGDRAAAHGSRARGVRSFSMISLTTDLGRGGPLCRPMLRQMHFVKLMQVRSVSSRLSVSGGCIGTHCRFIACRVQATAADRCHRLPHAEGQCRRSSPRPLHWANGARNSGSVNRLDRPRRQGQIDAASGASQSHHCPDRFFLRALQRFHTRSTCHR